MEKNLFNTPIGRLRLSGIAEGISFLLLLGIAMPLKYMAGIPAAVLVMGSIHGVLFILYLFALLNVRIRLRWSFTRLFIAFIASLIPFGTFILDRQWKKENR